MIRTLSDDQVILIDTWMKDNPKQTDDGFEIERIEKSTRKQILNKNPHPAFATNVERYVEYRVKNEYF